MKSKGQYLKAQGATHIQGISSNQHQAGIQRFSNGEISSKVLKGSNIFSRLFFTWISCVLEYGNNNQIDTSDLPVLYSSHHPSIQFQSLQNKFHNSAHSPRQGHTLIKSIGKAYKGSLIYIGLLALAMTILSMAAPTLTHLIISYVKQSSQSRQLKEGLLLLSATAGLALAKALIQSHLYFKFAVFGFNLSNTLSLLIYSKALKYPAASQNKYSLPQIINYSQVDAQRMTSMGPQLTAVLYTPLQIIIGVYLMYSYIGLSFAAGICTMVVLIAFTLHLAKRIGKINKTTNEAKDKRTKITQEMLEIIRFIKLNTLEKYFYKNVDLKREAQLHSNAQRGILDVIVVFVFFISCPLIVFLTFFTFVQLGHSIDASIAFSTIMIFNILQAPLRQFPSSLGNVIQMFSSLKRIQKFLFADQINQSHVISCEDKDLSIRISNGTFGWVINKQEKQEKQKPKGKQQKIITSKVKINQTQSLQTNQRYVIDDHQSMDASHANILDHQLQDQNYVPAIQHININIQKGSFVLIIGDIGSGKSSLLLGILNQMKSTSKTTIQISDSIAYAAQKPCIIGGTVKDNILFGLPYDKTRFEQAVYLAALGEDLKQLVKGQMTEIGEKGINLSGGQKMRISLARAIYSNRQILLLDDIVSAVDANIAEFIVKVALRAFSRGKTILMATHSIKFAEFADKIIIMRDGSIAQYGSFKVISETDDFRQIVINLSKELILSKDIEQDKKIQKQQKKVKQALQIIKQKCIDNSQNFYAAKAVENLIIPEDHQRGNIQKSVLSEYINQNGGKMFVFLTLGSMFGWLSLSILSSIQIQAWCQDEGHPNFYLYAYLLLSTMASLCAFVRSLSIIIAGLKQGMKVHKNIIKSLLYASLSDFFERVPVGRIMNRLTKDMRELDESIGNSLSYFLNNSFTLMGTIIICIYGSSFLMIIPVVIVIHFCNKLRIYYMKTQREMIRIQSKTNSPIVEGFVSAMHGMTTIRAYKMQKWFFQQQIKRIETNKRSRITRQALESWFAFRLTILSFFISILSIAFALINTSTEPALVGLLLSYALTLNDDIITLTFSWASLEIKFVAIERIYNFMKIQPERHYKEYCQDYWSPEQKSFKSVLQRGDIQFQQVTVKYRSDLPNALYSISFQVEAGEKVGIVGRTGAGKTTIFNSLLKIADPEQGNIFIDGNNYQNISAKDLRNSITIIDQEPVLIDSTFRQNLDRQGAYSDNQLYKFLEDCKLHDIVMGKGGLEGQVNNQSLSAGQKQLFCICRALLKKSKIVLIDEATANVDLKHDALIQEIIDKKLKECTVLTIAHRLSTLSHAGKVIVMDAGRIMEMGDPKDLKNRPGSIYADLVKKEKSQFLA